MFWKKPVAYETLAEAVLGGDEAAVRRLLEAGADANATVNKSGMTVLMRAAELGHAAIVRALIEHGAAVNATEKKEQQTGLLLACWEGHGEVAEILLAHGADPRHVKKGAKTALMYAAKSGNADIVKRLLEAGLDPDERNDEGQNALMYASNDDRNLESVRLLVAHGAKVNLPDHEQKSALMWSAFHGSTGILEFLLDNGGDLTLIDCFGDNIRQYAKTARRNREKTLAILAKHGVKRLPYCYGYSLRTTCPRCGQPVHVNGPLQRVPCAACGSIVPLGDEFWTHVFETATDSGATVSSFGGAGMELDYRRMNPVCPSCKVGLDASLVAPGTDGTFPCPACGAAHATFPVPEWMEGYAVKGKHPFQVYCALERDGQVAMEQSGGAEAVVIRCASCAASLTIDRQTPRSAVCQHCGVTQYLPDPLWRALHPVKTREWWYLRFR